MAYEPTNWKTGDVVTSAKLNKLENAVANGGWLICNATPVSGTEYMMIDKTWQEIHDSIVAGCPVAAISGGELNTVFIICIGTQFLPNGAFAVTFDNNIIFYSSSKNGILTTEETTSK